MAGEEMAGDSFPSEIKEPFEKLPAGTVLLTIEEVAEGMAGKEGDEVLAINVSFVGEEPASALGVHGEDMFWIGVRETDRNVTSGRAQADPEAQLAATWTARLGRFEKMASKAGVEIKGKGRQLVYSELKGRQVLALIEHSINKNNPDFTDAKVKSYWAVGEREPALSDAPPKAAAPAAGPRPSAGPAPIARPAAAAQAATPRPPVRRLGAR